MQAGSAVAHAAGAVHDRATCAAVDASGAKAVTAGTDDSTTNTLVVPSLTLNATPPAGTATSKSTLNAPPVTTIGADINANCAISGLLVRGSPRS